MSNLIKLTRFKDSCSLDKSFILLMAVCVCNNYIYISAKNFIFIDFILNNFYNPLYLVFSDKFNKQTY